MHTDFVFKTSYRNILNNVETNEEQSVELELYSKNKQKEHLSIFVTYFIFVKFTVF